MGQVRVVVTRIERDGTMHRRMMDTAQQSNPRNWEHLAARALAIYPPYRPIPGTAVYHLRVDGHIIQVSEYDLQGPLRDLDVVVLAIGSTLLAAVLRGTEMPKTFMVLTSFRAGRRPRGERCVPRVRASCPDGAGLMSIRWGRGRPGVLRRVAPWL